MRESVASLRAATGVGQSLMVSVFGNLGGGNPSSGNLSGVNLTSPASIGENAVMEGNSDLSQSFDDDDAVVVTTDDDDDDDDDQAGGLLRTSRAATGA